MIDTQLSITVNFQEDVRAWLITPMTRALVAESRPLVSEPMPSVATKVASKPPMPRPCRLLDRSFVKSACAIETKTALLRNLSV